MRTPVYILALVAAAGLGACGGGGSFELPAPAAREVPASALASPEAFSRYVGSIAPDDTAEPLRVDQIAPPISETAEPIVVS